MFTYYQKLKADIDARTKKLDIISSINNTLFNEDKFKLEVELYELEQEMDALTGDDDGNR